MGEASGVVVIIDSARGGEMDICGLDDDSRYAEIADGRFERCVFARLVV
jgi:hypothetical protein